MDRILTIGAYGFTPEQFFAALEASDVDLFIDVRQRRGMRGSRFAFANAKRLQQELETRGIDYRHVRELAPSTETRQLQKMADAEHETTKAGRTALTPSFIAAYEKRNVEPFAWDAFLVDIGKYHAPVIFCVERMPDACHRSLVANRLADSARAQIEHLTP
jgi:uncharacterized protein (DUF488 family)